MSIEDGRLGVCNSLLAAIEKLLLLSVLHIDFPKGELPFVVAVKWSIHK